jgi:branched-chain amino acid transport system permease protein
MALTEALVLGLPLGLVYATLGVGFSLTWGTLNVINVSHAAFAVLGAYLGYFANASFGIDPTIALLGIVPGFFIVGVTLQEGIFRPLAKRAEEAEFASLVLTFGLAIVLENLMVVVFSADPRLLRTEYTSMTVDILGVPVTGGRLVGAGLAVLTLLVLYLFLRRTYTGTAVRAVTQDSDGAALTGINERRVSAITFGLGLATAGVAGVAAAMYFPFGPSEHYSWLISVFIVTILGGVGSIVGAAIAGLVTGLVFELSAIFVPFSWVRFVLFSLLIGLLVVRPEGLFKR